MCGIAGIVHTNPDVVQRAILVMNRMQIHRGPDDEGSIIINNNNYTVALGHRRLAIIDVSAAGHQPMMDKVTRNWIVYNGEIYNFLSIRRELEKYNCCFHTRTDTEVILKAYSIWGSKCVEKFRGIFAFAIWDYARQCLFIARDQLGVKPLYYYSDDKKLLFASEVRAILATELMPRLLDYGGLCSYFAYGSVQEPFTMIKGMRSLPSGYWMMWKNGYIKKECYWTITSSNNTKQKHHNSIYSDVSDKIEEAVVSQMVSDVPLGVFLSGGIDSTVITTLMQKNSSRKIRTFSIVFDDPKYDERKYSRIVSCALGTHHSEVLITQKNVKENLELAIESYDQPSIDGLNTWFISKEAKKSGLTVVLSGVGGDELFVGYDNFKRALLAERYGRIFQSLPISIRSFLFKNMIIHSKNEMIRKALDLLTTNRDPYFIVRKLFCDTQIKRFLSRDLQCESTWESEAYYKIENEASEYDLFNRISFLEIQTYMRSTLLRDTDQMSMAHSLEVRVPLIDKDLVEVLFNIPGYIKYSKRQYKHLLARTLKTLFPPYFLNRHKMGFEFPFEIWLKEKMYSEIQDSLISRSANKESWLFDRFELKRLWYQFLSGNINWSRVWSVYMIQQWIKRNKVYSV